jgi:hypothetical protein
MPETNPLSPMEFDGELTEVPVRVNGVEYVLREATGDVACKYRNAITKQTTLTESQDESRTIKVGNIADSEPYLVHLCLFDTENNNVPLSKVRSWPPKVVSALYNRAKEISELDQDEDVESLIKQRDKLNQQIAKLQKEDPAKNEQSGIPLGFE